MAGLVLFGVVAVAHVSGGSTSPNGALYVKAGLTASPPIGLCHTLGATTSTCTTEAACSPDAGLDTYSWKPMDPCVIGAPTGEVSKLPDNFMSGFKPAPPVVAVNGVHGVQGLGNNVAPVTAPSKPAPPANVQALIPGHGGVDTTVADQALAQARANGGFFQGTMGGIKPAPPVVGVEGVHGVQGKGSNVAPVTAPTKPSPPAQVGTIPSNGLGAGGNGFFAGVNGGANPFASPLFTQPQTWSPFGNMEPTAAGDLTGPSTFTNYRALSDDDAPPSA